MREVAGRRSGLSATVARSPRAYCEQRPRNRGRNRLVAGSAILRTGHRRTRARRSEKLVKGEGHGSLSGSSTACSRQAAGKQQAL